MSRTHGIGMCLEILGSGLIKTPAYQQEQKQNICTEKTSVIFPVEIHCVCVCFQLYQYS